MVDRNLRSPSIVDPDTGQLIGRQPPVSGSGAALESVFDAAIDASGRTLAIAYGSGALQVFDLRSGDTRTDLHAHDPQIVTEVAFSLSGRTLYSASDDGTVQIRDVATFEQVGLALTAPQRASSGSFVDVAVSPDDRTLVAAGTELVRWDIDVGSWAARACTIANRNLTGSEWTQYFGGTVDHRETCPGLP